MRQLKKFFKLLSFDGIAAGEHRYSVIHQVKYALEFSNAFQTDGSYFGGEVQGNVFLHQIRKLLSYNLS